MEATFHHDGDDVRIFFGVVDGEHVIPIFLHFPAIKSAMRSNMIEESGDDDCADGSDHEIIMSFTIHVMLINASAQIALIE